MKKTTSEIKDIVLFGGNVILDANDYTTSSLKDIAGICKGKGLTLTLKNAKEKTTSELKQLAVYKCVVFDLT